jgi:uracil DNA glycosylase
MRSSVSLLAKTPIINRQGHDLAFSVLKGVPPPPMLKNIFKEAMDDVGIEPPKHGNLDLLLKLY